MNTDTKPRRAYRQERVRLLVGEVSLPTLYRIMDRDPSFPKPRKLAGTQTNIWDADAVDAWIAAQFTKLPEAS